MSSSFPAIVPGGGLLIAYQLKGKRVLIVGGGPVAAGRLVNVKDADAHVTVIAPGSGLCKEMRYRIENGTVDVYHDRTFGSMHEELDLSSDVSPNHAPKVQYDLVLTAIDDPQLSREICRACRDRRIPVNVADVPPECDFYFGSLIRRGPLQVMVSTGGNGPKLAALIRQRIANVLPDATGPAIENTGRLRLNLRRMAPNQQEGKKRMAWMSSVCTTWSLEDLASLDDTQIPILLGGYNASPPIVLTRNEVLNQIQPSRPLWAKAGQVWASLSAHTSDALASPLVAALAGAVAGTFLTTSLFLARDAHRR